MGVRRQAAVGVLRGLGLAERHLARAVHRRPPVARTPVRVRLWPVSRWLSVPGVVGMHAGIYATIHLNYVAMAATVVIVYVNWAWIADRLKERSGERQRLRPEPART